MKRKQTRRDIYQEVTDKILGFIDQGNLPPWRMPILGRGTGGRGHPRNLVSKRRYRGVNTFLLAITSWSEGYTSDYWLTFKQAKQRGGQVRKGEKGTLVTFWKQYATEDKETGQERTLPVLRHYVAFNAEQCDGIDAPDLQADEAVVEPPQPIRAAFQVVAGFREPPQIEYKGRRAVYIRSRDAIEIAPPGRFVSSEEHYATLFHEMAHATGHERRLNRPHDEDHAFGTAAYAKEELIAEFTAAMLCAEAGISPPTIENAAAYIDGWSKQLKADKRIVVQAAGQAQRAADYILGETLETGPRQDA